MDLVYVPSGCFHMGQTDEDKKQIIAEAGQETYDKYFDDELPRHRVCLDGFWMADREVTREQWQRFITESGYRHGPTQNPEARDHVHAEISFETMSAYLDLAFNGNDGRYPDLPQEGWTPWNDDPRVQAVVLFALGGYPPDWGHTNWVTLDNQGRITAAYPITLRR